jgi:thiamine-monophosphate kinase
VSAEIDLITDYFRDLGVARSDVVLGIGDDAAIVRESPGCDLIMTTDSLVEGSHFLPGADPRSLGHRALVINLSDCAAMGASPCWALLSLNLPAVDHSWLQQFCAGFGALLQRSGVALIGGNLTRGPLSITVQMAGSVPAGAAVTRSGGKPGDLLCLSGSTGDAAAGRELLARPGTATADSVRSALCQRFEFPTARVALGVALRGLASACIDVSDGLWVDLERLAAASRCGAEIEHDALPLSAALQAYAPSTAMQLALCGGEDYELLFTLPQSRLAALQAHADATSTPCTVIGRLCARPGVTLRRAGSVMQFSPTTFDHFAVRN